MLPQAAYGSAIGFSIGVGSLALVGYKAAPEVMTLEDESAFSYAETISTLKQAAAEQGWKIPKVHELHKSMAKHGHGVDPVTVFEPCHTDHAASAQRRRQQGRNIDDALSGFSLCRRWRKGHRFSNELRDDGARIQRQRCECHENGQPRD